MLTGYGSNLAPARGDSHANDVAANRISGAGAVGLGFLSGDLDDDDDEEKPSSTVTAPRPAYSSPVPVAAPPRRVPPDTARRPPPTLTQGEKTGHYVQLGSRAQVQVAIPNTAQPIPRPPKAVFVDPPGLPRTQNMSPHPLQAPKTPIQPAFARPKLSDRPSEIKFSEDSILRGNSEETLLSRSTQKGADFWRRFSVVVKEDGPVQHKSSWLSKTQSHGSRMRLCIWLISISLLVGLAGLSVLIWYFTHGKPASAPVSFTGNADQGVASTTSSAAVASATSTSRAPLHTVTGNLPPSATSNPAATVDVVKRFSDALIPMASPSPLTVPVIHRRHSSRRVR